MKTETTFLYQKGIAGVDTITGMTDEALGMAYNEFGQPDEGTMVGVVSSESIGDEQDHYWVVADRNCGDFFIAKESRGFIIDTSITQINQHIGLYDARGLELDYVLYTDELLDENCDNSLGGNWKESCWM